jgi:hypothetical protein
MIREMQFVFKKQSEERRADIRGGCLRRVSVAMEHQMVQPGESAATTSRSPASSRRASDDKVSEGAKD